MPGKREEYLLWDEFFMSIAFLSAQRSKDPAIQLGACIVNKDKKVVGIGYNGMPRGCYDDEMPWNTQIDNSRRGWYNCKLPYVCHAELNAVLNKNQANMTDCIIYVMLFPCNMCAKVIIQSGIREVVYYSDQFSGHVDMVASRRLLNTAGISCREFKLPNDQFIIDFTSIEDAELQEPNVYIGRPPDRNQTRCLCYLIANGAANNNVTSERMQRRGIMDFSVIVFSSIYLFVVLLSVLVTDYLL